MNTTTLVSVNMAILFLIFSLPILIRNLLPRGFTSMGWNCMASIGWNK